MRFDAVAWDLDDTVWIWDKESAILSSGIIPLLRNISTEKNGIITNGQKKTQMSMMKRFGIVEIGDMQGLRGVIFG